MAALHISVAARNAALNALVDQVDAGAGAGSLKIYNGTIPESADTAVSTQVLLAELVFNDPAFGAASAGAVAANSITQDSSANNTGQATWARVADSDGNAIFDMDVGTGDTTLVLNTANIVAGGVVRVLSATIALPDGT